MLTVAPQPTEKYRPVNKFQRMRKGPAEVHKIGHFGMCVTNFAKSLAFWTTYFNFKPSDVSMPSPLVRLPPIPHCASKLLHTTDGRDITAFVHLDRGEELVDHHCFFLFEGPRSHVHHSSFEVFDFDSQVLGHDWLLKQGYENCWGVGRHILGSQIFDYWYGFSKWIRRGSADRHRFDPSKFILEHYVDGDLVNCESPIAKDVASPDGLSIWGEYKAVRSKRILVKW